MQFAIFTSKSSSAGACLSHVHRRQAVVVCVTLAEMRVPNYHAPASLAAVYLGDRFTSSLIEVNPNPGGACQVCVCASNSSRCYSPADVSSNRAIFLPLHCSAVLVVCGPHHGGSGPNSPAYVMLCLSIKTSQIFCKQHREIKLQLFLTLSE